MAEISQNGKIGKRVCSFSDLSDGIIGNIVYYLDPMNRFVVRKVNRNLRTLINNRYKDIKCSFDDTNISLKFGFSNESIKYVDDVLGCKVKCGKNEKLVDGGDYVKTALSSLFSILKTPELKLEKLTFSMNAEQENHKKQSEKCYKVITTFLKSLNHKIHVETCHFEAWDWEDIVSILPYLKAGTLEDIVFMCGLDVHTKHEEEIVLNKIFKMDQWKSAKNAVISLVNSVYVNHFSHLSIAVYYMRSVTEMHVREIQKAFFKTSNLLNFCRLQSRSAINIAEVKNALGQTAPNDSNIRQYRIPGTKESFELRMTEEYIEFKRK